MQLGKEQKKASLHRHRSPTDFLWKCASVLTLGGFIVAIFWLAASTWKRIRSDVELESMSRVRVSRPMQLSPLIAGKDKANPGELVYLTRVLLKPGPTPKGILPRRVPRNGDFDRCGSSSRRRYARRHGGCKGNDSQYSLGGRSPQTVEAQPA